MVIVSPVYLWCNFGSIFELILCMTPPSQNVKALKRENGELLEMAKESSASLPCVAESPIDLKSLCVV